MNHFIHYLKSDLYKLRHSWLILLHILIPFLGAGLTIIYAILTGSDTDRQTAVFFQILAAAFPFVTSVVCMAAAEQEESAGHQQNLLLLPDRFQVILSKYLLLACGALVSVFLCSLLYCIFLSLHASDFRFSSGTLVIQPIVLWLSSLVLYSIHLFTAFRFGKNLCLGIGAAGSLLAALMQTGLGDGLWYKLPYGWASRFSSFALKASVQTGAAAKAELKAAILYCTVLTAVSIGFLFLWFSRYEGKHTAD